jgi:hypothetical protein
MADYSDRITELVNGPNATTDADGRSVTPQKIEDVIAAEKYANAKAGAAKNHFGLRFVKPVNTGAPGFQ